MPALVQLNTGNQEDPLQNVSGYDAERVSMGNEDSVENRVAKLSSEESPIIQLAQTRARQDASRSGRLNTSMTGGEVIKAGIETALPIASQDAGTAAQYKLSNQAAGNRASEFGAGAVNTAKTQIESGNQALEQIGTSGTESRLTDTNQGLISGRLQGEANTQQLERIAAAGGVESSLQSERSTLLREEMNSAFGYDEMLQQLKGEQAEVLTLIETRSNQLMQASESAALTFSTFAQSIGEILANPDIDASAKDALVQKQLDLLETAMTMEGAIANFDTAGLLEFGGSSIAPDITFGRGISAGEQVPGIAVNDDGDITINDSQVPDEMHFIRGRLDSEEMNYETAVALMMSGDGYGEFGGVSEDVAREFLSSWAPGGSKAA